MLFGFNTENEIKAKAAMLIYVIYKKKGGGDQIFAGNEEGGVGI